MGRNGPAEASGYYTRFTAAWPARIAAIEPALWRIQPGSHREKNRTVFYGKLDAGRLWRFLQRRIQHYVRTRAYVKPAYQALVFLCASGESDLQAPALASHCDAILEFRVHRFDAGVHVVNAYT
jgi:hypothetical protein